ncbi:MAG TPA: hypothetical protein VN842_01890 [Thermoplasmata archaeon]|nr:hypothetical protein [Thermoplasmata archaeon]
MKTYSLRDAGIRLPEDVRSEVRAAAFRGLVSAAHKTVEVVVSEIIPSFGDRMPVDRGAYRAGWRVQPMRSEGKVLVLNTAPHAVLIEEGVRAGNVKIGRKMIDALAEWVRRKGIGGRSVTSASGRTRLVKASRAEAASIAWAIAKDMRRRGIFNRGGEQGLGIMRKAERRIPAIIKTEVTRELRKLK